jgi:glycolate oxidase iron-sulfur subunit
MFTREEALAEAIKCSGCGFCLSVCPVYEAVGIETLSSRGRVDTLRGVLLGQLELSERMMQILDTCLLCRACEEVCPPGVKLHRVLMEGRAKAVRQRGLPWAKRLAFRRLLKDRRYLSRALGYLRPLLKEDRGIPGSKIRHLPSLFSGLAGGRGLPPIASRPLRARVGPVTAPVGNPRGRVGFFSGCYMEFVETGMGDATVGVLSQEGFEVFYPREQTCCGAPALYSGDVEDALEIALKNARAFLSQKLDSVIVGCATCFDCLKKGYSSLSSSLQGEEKEMLEEFSSMVEESSSFLVKKGLSRRRRLSSPNLVTYHDPCHLSRGGAIVREPRELLASIEGLELKEMSQPRRCCGGGGSFGLAHPEISIEIGRWKVQDIQATGAKIAVTSCPGCILQIQEVARREGAEIKAVHLMELLRGAL